MARSNPIKTEEELSFRDLPFSALRAVLREGYSGKQLGADLAAGFLVGIVALPLAMALSIAVGLPPQYGLYTSIIAGFVTPLLGGSRVQVVGPTAAFIVILAPIVATQGLAGLLIAGMMAGVILVTAALLRLGRMIEYIPFPVTTGFTSGIAVVIAGLQLKDALGLKVATNPEHFLAKMAVYFDARGTVSAAEACVALATLAVLLIPRLPRRWLAKGPKMLRKVPLPLVALPLGALMAWWFNQHGDGWHVITLGERFSYMLDGKVMQGIPRSLPAFALPWTLNGANVNLGISSLQKLFSAAFAIAALGAIESLLSAVVADGMGRTRHDPNSELFALGISNIITPFFGGIPATGAIARTATNYRFGGRTPFAAMTHALTILIAVLLAAPLLAWLPMSSLAALLLLVAWNMSELEHFIYTLKVAPTSDKAVLLICFGLTVALDMVVAVSVGVALGALFFMRRMANLTAGRAVPKDEHLKTETPPPGVILYEINGPLFFGAAERAMSALRSIGNEARAVVFKLDNVVAIDMTGLVAMESALKELKRHGIKAVICGTRPQVHELFLKSGIKPEPGVLAYAVSPKAAYTYLAAQKKRPPRKESGPLRFNILQRHKSGAKNSRRQAG